MPNRVGGTLPKMQQTDFRFSTSRSRVGTCAVEAAGIGPENTLVADYTKQRDGLQKCVMRIASRINGWSMDQALSGTSQFGETTKAFDASEFVPGVH